MTDKLLEPFIEDFGLLIEGGFVATKQLDENSARELFHAAQVLKPDSAAPKVGLGYISLNKLELKDAEEMLKEALEMDKEHHLARAFLGITYLLNDAKREEGQKLLEEAMEKSDDPAIKELGETSLAWADSDLKKNKAPFFGE